MPKLGWGSATLRRRRAHTRTPSPFSAGKNDTRPRAPGHPRRDPRPGVLPVGSLVPLKDGVEKQVDDGPVPVSYPGANHRTKRRPGMDTLQAVARILKMEGVEWVSCFPSNNLL